MFLVLVYTPIEIVVRFMDKLVEEDPALQGVLRSLLQFLETYSRCNCVTGDCRQVRQILAADRCPGTEEKTLVGTPP
jgi:hypothetical protein